jgi:hypothetical protein
MKLQALQEEFSEQEKQQFNEGANRVRIGRMANDERLTDTIPALRVGESVSRVIREIHKTDRRQIADVARALLERGVAAYLRDGQLFEPEEKNGGYGETVSSSERPATIPVRTITLGEDKAAPRKKNTA